MGRVSKDDRKFEKTRNITQFIYYTLAIVGISIYLLFVWIIPNISLPLNQITNGTIPLPP